MMNSRRLKRQFMAGSTIYTDSFVKKVRKPYTITKSRENWTDEEHDKFLEALHLFGRDWKKIEDYVGSKSVIQIRSHAQKYFLKIQKNGAIVHVPPPRPKRRAAYPYPQKPIKNASLVHSSTSSCVAPGIIQWDDLSVLSIVSTASDGSMSSQDDFIYLPPLEVPAAIVSESAVSLSDRSFGGGSSSIISDMPQQGMPDFAEVYKFIGSVFDLDTKGHLQKLKKMDQVNLETKDGCVLITVAVMHNMVANEISSA
ncbi:Reveille-like protein [Thalictrum thalictroides]|uniref:Reveille-like protein n=1 Tax=Thalictrum thalictroides TaxID=46969 RepID=A0A7J6VF48_THATH|nr:Reveille-like protein [Thalictrum thalictroides]